MRFLLYSQEINNPRINILAISSCFDLAKTQLAKKVHEYISFYEGENKLQFAHRLFVKDITENKELKDGLYYVEKTSECIELFQKTSVVMNGWFTALPVSEAKLVMNYIIVPIDENLLHLAPIHHSVVSKNEQGMHQSWDVVMKEFKQKSVQLKKHDPNKKN